MHDVMIDIEALSTQLGAVVLSLGGTHTSWRCWEITTTGAFPRSWPRTNGGRVWQPTWLISSRASWSSGYPLKMARNRNHVQNV